MFVHTCTSCDQRLLIFPSQITGVVNTEHGIAVTFTCYCEAEQVEVTGTRARRRTTATAAATTAA